MNTTRHLVTNSGGRTTVCGSAEAPLPAGATEYATAELADEAAAAIRGAQPAPVTLEARLKALELKANITKQDQEAAALELAAEKVEATE